MPTLEPFAHALDDDAYTAIVERAGAARFVLIGEASHGTHEFYELRAELTKRLVEEHAFDAVAAEADWPAAYRVNCYVRGRGDDRSAEEALGDFRRFPAWMWRNTVTVEFAEWLREHNTAASRPAGFYGLDLYSLHESMAKVVEYLEGVDREAAERARARYACFDHFGSGGDGQSYGFATERGLAEPCEEDAVAQLVELRTRAAQAAAGAGLVAEDDEFFAEQNARLVVNAERYYRAMFRGRASSWNLRDRHMAETLDALARHLARGSGGGRIVVWAHNSHLGDARATEMSRRGELNLGQLVRERHGREALLVGLSTYTGTVTAAADWGAPAERKRVRPALDGSWEDVFHELELPAFVLDPAAAGLREPRLQRAIGVIYRPETERLSHYFEARPAEQFDLLVHLDETRALEPLERTSGWEAGEVPETFPSAL